MQSRIWYFKANTATQIGICFVLLFGIPVLPTEFQGEVYLVTNIALLLVSATLIQHNNTKYVTIALAVTVARIVSRFFENIYVVLIEDIVSVVFFTWIALVLIQQVVKRPPAVETILEAIAGYFLLGIACTFVMGAIIELFPGSFLVNGVPLLHHESEFGLNSYFVFITYTTVGFGDILPANGIGRAFAKFVAISGQIYISVVVAILIGKYLQASHQKIS